MGLMVRNRDVGGRVRAFTLVELLVVVSIIALLIAILVPSLTKAREQARTVKCMANQHAQGLAILTYASEYQGTLPGPIHPAIKRQVHSSSNPLDRQKSLTWLLRPYYGKSLGDADREDKRADEISSCPTADRIVPDQDFFDYQSSGWEERPYSYVANTWGITDSGTTVSKAIASDTDPPHYFGAWFYTNSTPDIPGVAWWPKKIDRIKRPGEEWAVADAWYRRTSTAGSRSGGTGTKQWIGTFVPEIENYLAIIPDRPYHRISANRVSSHARTGQNVLPQITFKGSTSMVYFDGHAGLFFGQWRKTGDGGTVNPFWKEFGGKHDRATFRWNPGDYE